MGKRFEEVKKYKKIIIGLLLVVLGTVLILESSFAFFSDYIMTSIGAVTGTVKLEPIELLINGEQGVIEDWKPGDVTTIEWTVNNAGNKSIYTRNTLEIAWDVPEDMQEDEIIYLYPYTMSDDEIRSDIVTNNGAMGINIGNDKNTVKTSKNITKGYKYTFSGNILDGVGVAAEIGDSRTPDSDTHNLADGKSSEQIRYKLAFSLNATPIFQNSPVYVNVIAECWQYRNNLGVPPTITIANTNIYEMGIGEQIPEFIASAKNSKGENVTVEITNDINCYIPGTYTITFTATDSNGSTEVSTEQFEVKSTNISENIVMWLDASRIEGNDGDEVVFWEDLTGNGNNAVKATSTGINPPKLEKNVINGLSAVRFSDTTFESEETGLKIPNLKNSFTNEAQMFMVFEPLEQNKGNYVLLRNGEDSWDCYQGGPETGQWYGSAFGGRVNGQSYVCPTWGRHMYELKCATSEHKLYINNVLKYNGIENFRIHDTDFELGFNSGRSDKTYNGRIAEIIIYNKAISDEQREDIYEYLKGKWDI